MTTMSPITTTTTLTATPGLRSFKGTLVAVRLAANENADGLSIIEHHMPKGEATPLHIHRNEDEVFHIVSGTMRFEIGGRTVIGQGGDVLCAPKGVPHRFVVEAAEGVHCFTIMRGRDFETMVLEMSSPADAGAVPRALVPTPQMIEELTLACSRNGIDIIGPPMAA